MYIHAYILSHFISPKLITTDNLEAVFMNISFPGLPVLRHSNELEAVELCIKRRKNIQYIGAFDLGSTLSVSRVATTVKISVLL